MASSSADPRKLTARPRRTSTAGFWLLARMRKPVAQKTSSRHAAVLVCAGTCDPLRADSGNHERLTALEHASVHSR
jgi:hypothetical protein